MTRRAPHCKAITQVPEMAQTSTELKYDAKIEILDTIALAQRQAAWKAFYLPDDTTT